MPQSFASLYCHIVFSTKHREPWIKVEARSRLFAYVGGVVRNLSCHLVAAGGMSDHVHLLVSLARTLAVADAVRVVKSNSSRWMRNELRFNGFHWQSGYGAFAVSYPNVEQVKAYLANQEQHHRGMTFQDEFRGFLRRHELEWDERYVWD